MTNDQRYGAGDALVIDVFLNGFADALEALRRKSERLGLGGREILG